MEYIIPVNSEGVFLYKRDIPSFNIFSSLLTDKTNVFKLNKDYIAFDFSKTDSRLEIFKIKDLDFLSHDKFYIVRKAMGLINWDNKTKFCGYCGFNLELIQSENNGYLNYHKNCSKCNNKTFTYVNPAIIVAIVKDDSLLLANNIAWSPSRYSLIAGYTDTGEEIIDTVKREVFEETSLEIKDIKFIDTQFFPSPHNLMFGFFANYKSGEINLDKKELRDAKWVSRKDLLENKIEYSKGSTISAYLIKKFIDGYSV